MQINRPKRLDFEQTFAGGFDYEEALEKYCDDLEQQLNKETPTNYKELIDNLDIIISAVEWEYPIDYAATIDQAKKIICNYNELLDKAAQELKEKEDQLIWEFSGNIDHDLKLNTVESWKEWLLNDNSDI